MPDYYTIIIQPWQYITCFFLSYTNYVQYIYMNSIPYVVSFVSVTGLSRYQMRTLLLLSLLLLLRFFLWRNRPTRA